MRKNHIFNPSILAILWVLLTTGATHAADRKSHGSNRAENVKSAKEDTESPAAESSEPWNPSWHLQTSPFGNLFKRYNLQIGHFLDSSSAIAIKGTRMDNATQSIFGHDEGYEVGVRGSYYLTASPLLQFGGHLGVFYVNFKRGDDLGDAISYMFQSPAFDRDEAKSVMFEVAAGPLIHWNNWFTTEGLLGLQTYRVSYYTYNTSTGVSTARKPSSWVAYVALELNIGVAF